LTRSAKKCNRLSIKFEIFTIYLYGKVNTFMPCCYSQLYLSLQINIGKDGKTGRMAITRTEMLRYLSVAEVNKGLNTKMAYVLLHQADFLLTKFPMSAGFE
jgi:hypothetical protein